MLRQARLVAPGLAHHVTQRGNNRQDVLFVDTDRAVYLELLREQGAKYAVRVLGYCLMTNHVHLIARPEREESLNLAVGRAHFIYTQYFNRLHRRSGHLWQGRFHSCPMDRAYTIEAMRYVERNPVRARMTQMPWTYRWSSGAPHTGGEDKAELLDLSAWRDMARRMDWKQHLTQKDDKVTVASLRLNTHTGRPLAGHAFLKHIGSGAWPPTAPIARRPPQLAVPYCTRNV